MRRTALFVLAIALFAAQASAAPITVQALDPAATPAQNAAVIGNALFAGTAGITVTGVTYTGAARATGTFAGAGDVLGIEAGLLMTSGNVTNVVGPNNSTGAGVSNSLAGNVLLNTLVPGFTTFDASVINLTFIPEGQTLQFSYVFGSEEYNEYVNSQFNDVFGFFVNGTNFALLPGTTTPVSINNVNNGFTFGAGSGPCKNCAFFRDNAQNGGLGLNTQLDGLTTVLSFIAPVNPGVQNTLVLAIADAGDTILDSAVFIAGGSFAAPGADPDNPILPTLQDENGWVFNFFVVNPAIPIFIDPLVAIGYDFIVNSGPNFQSVILPDIGDGLYDIYDSLGNLLAGAFPFGTPFDFGVGGISAFTVLGIEAGAGLDPNDPLAFVTGLTFAGVGQVNMNMNPITEGQDDATVPEPATILMVSAGLAAVLRQRHRRRA